MAPRKRYWKRYWTVKLENDPLGADYAVVTHSKYRHYCILHRYAGHNARNNAWRDARKINDEYNRMARMRYGK